MSVENFEKAVCEYCEVSHAVAFNSGTSAMHAAYAAAEAGPLDRVITSPNTHIGTITGAVLLGAEPQFVDIDLKSGHLSLPGRLELASRGRYLYVPVHFAGIPMDMKKFDLTITDPYAMVIEDATGAFGARYNDGKRLGSCAHSDMTVFSFHSGQVISTEQGGMVVTNVDGLAEKLRAFCNNGGPKPTGNFAMSTMQAKKGMQELGKVDAAIEKRQSALNIYHEELKGIPNIQLLEFPKGSAPSLAIVLVDIEDQEKVVERLLKQGITVNHHYRPLYRHPLFDDALREAFPMMEAYDQRRVSLPLDTDRAKSISEALVHSLRQ